MKIQPITPKTVNEHQNKKQAKQLKTIKQTHNQNIMKQNAKNKHRTNQRTNQKKIINENAHAF